MSRKGSKYNKRPPIKKRCKICGIKFNVLWARRHRVVCSIECRNKLISEKRKKNNPGGFKKRKKRLNFDDSFYTGLHHWIRRNFGTPDTCEKCGRSGLSGKFINWANKNGKYNKERKNWIRLCKKCHYWYDLYVL